MEMKNFEIRKFTFGRFKGENILYIIATRPGYVAWIRDNIKWVDFTEFERLFYDWMAAPLNGRDNKIKLPFNMGVFNRHVGDWRQYWSLDYTPLRYNNCSGGYIWMNRQHELYETIKSIMRSNFPEGPVGTPDVYDMDVPEDFLYELKWRD